MTETFRASDGARIEVHDNNSRIDIKCTGSSGEQHFLSVKETQAAREFFQHERDEERGLWRSPSDPTWTAVRRNTTIYFQNEDHERSFHFVPKLEGSIRAWSSGLQALAYEYIEAHPERKPWHDAQQNELWELQISGCHDPEIYRFAQDTTCADSRVYRPVNNPNRVFFHPDSSLIAAGRRIWPEDAA